MLRRRNHLANWFMAAAAILGNCRLKMTPLGQTGNSRPLRIRHRFQHRKLGSNEFEKTCSVRELLLEILRPQIVKLLYHHSLPSATLSSSGAGSAEFDDRAHWARGTVRLKSSVVDEQLLTDDGDKPNLSVTALLNRCRNTTRRSPAENSSLLNQSSRSAFRGVYAFFTRCQQVSWGYVGGRLGGISTRPDSTSSHRMPCPVPSPRKRIRIGF
jgi:hypothetical protein